MKQLSLKFSLIAILASLLVMPVLVSAQEDGNSEVVASVNGERITMQELEKSALENAKSQINQLAGMLRRFRPNFARFLATNDTVAQEYSDYIKSSVLNAIIEDTLIKQKEEEYGITVSDEEVQSKLQELIDSTESIKDKKALEQILASRNTKMEDFETSIANNLKREKLRDEIVGEVTIDDEDIEKYYNNNKNQFKKEDGSVKPLEDVKGQIVDTLKNQEKQQKWNEWLNNAKEEADIQNNLETSNQ